jgi:hypothetical protein
MLLLASMLACTQPPASCPPSEVAVVKPSASSLLDELAGVVEATGAGALVRVSDEVVSEGDRTGAFLTPAEDACLVVYARGSEGVRDLDLFVFTDDGGALASDEGGSNVPAVLVCPPLADRVFAMARVASGFGRVAIGAHRVPPALAPRVAAATRARLTGEESGRLESWPGLEVLIAQHRRALGASWEDVRRFATVVDPRASTRATVVVEPRRCLDVFALPSEDVPSLELFVESEDGRVIARADGGARERSIVICSEQGEAVTFVMRPRQGGGHVAFIAARSGRDAVAELSPSVVVRRASPSGSPAETRDALVAKERARGWGTAVKVGGGEAKVGSVTTVSIELDTGCSRLDVYAGAPLGPFDVLVWSRDARLLAEGGGGLRASALACVSEKQRVRVDVTSRGRAGPFLVERRPLESTPPLLLRHPRAAARLFERAALDELDWSAVRVSPLRAGELLTLPLSVGASGCLEPIVALDGEIGGFDLRLVDPASGTDALARGRFVASRRLCFERAKHASLELGLDDGASDALVVVRE